MTAVTSASVSAWIVDHDPTSISSVKGDHRLDIEPIAQPPISWPAVRSSFPQSLAGSGDVARQWLEVSPYLDQEHLLDLGSLDLPNQLLALSLTILKPATEAYAAARYEDAFDWPAVMIYLHKLLASTQSSWKKHEFYVVEFRSKLKPQIDNELLFKLDKESHREATQSGGLLKYWYGNPDDERRNLATCLWRSREDAMKGGLGPYHKQARAVIPKMYEQIDVKGLRLTIEDDVRSWSFESST